MRQVEDLETPEVVIVGAGPAGLVAALTLANAGVSVRILEKGSDLSTESRASTFHPSSMQVFERLGFIEELHRGAVKVPRVQFRDRVDGPFATLDYSLLQEHTTYPYRLQIEQSKITRRIAQRLATMGIHVDFDHEVVQALADGDTSVVTVSTPRGVVDIKPRIVLGADGATSIVRRTIGRAFSGMTYPERYLVVSTVSPLEEIMGDIELVNYVSDPNEWLAILKTPDHWRVTFPLGDEVDEGAAQQPVELRRRLHEVTGEEIDFTHSNIYRVHRRVASNFGRGSTFLIGDAAHVNNPLGGLGMNSGVLDAYFVSRRVAAYLAGDQSLEYVKAYADVHRDLALNVVGKQTNYNWVALRESDETARSSQQRELAAIATDPVRSIQHLRGSALLKALEDLDSGLGAG